MVVVFSRILPNKMIVQKRVTEMITMVKTAKLLRNKIMPCSNKLDRKCRLLLM